MYMVARARRLGEGAWGCGRGGGRGKGVEEDVDGW